MFLSVAVFARSSPTIARKTGFLSLVKSLSSGRVIQNAESRLNFTISKSTQN